MRIRSKVHGTAEKPRLSVYKSNKFVYGQLIDDERGVTLASGSSRTAKAGQNDRERAHAAGQALAKEAGQKGIERIVFDRNGFIYTGRVRAFADGARDGGLMF